MWWLPILKPAIISVALFQFAWSMNDFIGPLISPVYSVDKYPIALALKMSIDVPRKARRGTKFGNGEHLHSAVHHCLLPGSQRYFVQGVTSSGIKG